MTHPADRAARRRRDRADRLERAGHLEVTAGGNGEDELVQELDELEEER